MVYPSFTRALPIAVALLAAACSFDPKGVPIASDAGTTTDAPTPIDADPTECIGQPDGMACGDQTDTACTDANTCLSEQCVPNHTAADTPCGDDTVDSCTAADSCDGAGNCQANDMAAGTTCGDPAVTPCSDADTCDGAGTCQQNDLAAGTTCGDDTVSECTAADTCDGAGTCDANHTQDAQNCNDCPSGSCDVCQGGVCLNDVLCSENSCIDVDDCAAGVTNNTCIDGANDCTSVTCVGSTPGGPIEAGAPGATDFTTWQSDTNTFLEAGTWYCNATTPVSQDGVLNTWDLFVANGGNNGGTALLLVIRCNAGGGGNGPALSDCSRVGEGPLDTFSGNGLHSFSLAGSLQLDAATPDNDGIVVQAGDTLCALSEDMRIGMDCNGSASTGCIGTPLMDTQWQDDIDFSGEPFDLNDSSRNGVLMIKATGTSTPIAGQCSDSLAVPDGDSCSVGGGDTCCSGACVVGPGGAGNCS